MTTAMDIQTMQSMDWLFKKERIYLLAQFWQQVREKMPHLNITRSKTLDRVLNVSSREE